MSGTAKKVYIRLGAAIVLTFVLTPMLAAWVLPDVRWHRVATRTFLVGLILIFAAGAGDPRTWLQKLRGLGLRGPMRGERFLIGAVMAFMLIVILLLAGAALGGRGASVLTPSRSLLSAIGRALFTAGMVSVIEEILCRGFLKDTIGGAMSALLYAGAHYFRPMHRTAPADGYDPLLVFRRFPDLLEGWTRTNHFTFGLLGLFLFGLALNRLKDRTGTLYMGIGVHFGVVFGLKMYSRWIERNPGGSRMIWGSSRLHDGLLGALIMLACLIWAYRGRIPTAETPRIRAT